MQRLENKIAIVTGAARAIGKAIAERFVAEGAHVIITDVLDEEGQQTAAELGHAEFIHQDVSDETSWKNLLEQVIILQFLICGF